MAHALTTILQGKRPSRPTGNRTMRLGLWCCVKACWMHQPSTRPSAQMISRFLKNYKSDPSTFPEFGQIKEASRNLTSRGAPSELNLTISPV